MFNHFGNDDLYQGRICSLLLSSHRVEIWPNYRTFWLDFDVHQIRYQLPAIHEEEPVTVIDYVWKKIRECNLIINPIKTHLMFLNQPKSDSWKLPHEVTKRHDQHFPQSLLGKMFHLANCHLFLLDGKYPYDMSAF